MVLKSFLFFFLIIGAAVAKYELEYDDFFTYDESQDQKCSQPGRMCKNCKTVAFCIQMPDDTLLQETLYDCDSGKTCMDSLNDCTNVTNPKCDSNIVGFTFTCHQLGIFPDPFDCTKYHMCIEDKQTVGSRTIEPEGRSITVKTTPNSYKCGSGFSYDPLSTQCRNKLVNGTCTNFVQPCTSVGQSGAIAVNPSIYYICLKDTASGVFFPHMFMCPAGQAFNGVKCESSPPAVGADGKCIVKGLFDDPITCKKFLECPDKNANPIRRDCPTGFKFNYYQKKCIEMTCQ